MRHCLLYFKNSLCLLHKVKRMFRISFRFHCAISVSFSYFVSPFFEILLCSLFPRFLFSLECKYMMSLNRIMDIVKSRCYMIVFEISNQKTWNLQTSTGCHRALNNVNISTPYCKLKEAWKIKCDDILMWPLSSI